MLDASALQKLLRAADAEFDTRSAERLALGAEKYGAFKFLSVDTLEEAMQEILDLGNYARMTYIKLRLLKEEIAAASVPQADTEGFKSFKEQK
jgi:hypothetical protein